MNWRKTKHYNSSPSSIEVDKSAFHCENILSRYLYCINFVNDDRKSFLSFPAAILRRNSCAFFPWNELKKYLPLMHAEFKICCSMKRKKLSWKHPWWKQKTYWKTQQWKIFSHERKTRKHWSENIANIETKHWMKTVKVPVPSGSFKSRRHREANGTAVFYLRVASAANWGKLKRGNKVGKTDIIKSERNISGR